MRGRGVERVREEYISRLTTLTNVDLIARPMTEINI